MLFQSLTEGSTELQNSVLIIVDSYKRQPVFTVPISYPCMLYITILHGDVSNLCIIYVAYSIYEWSYWTWSFWYSLSVFRVLLSFRRALQHISTCTALAPWSTLSHTTFLYLFLLTNPPRKFKRKKNKFCSYHYLYFPCMLYYVMLLRNFPCTRCRLRLLII